MSVRIGLVLVAILVLAGCSTTDTRLGTPISCDTAEPARLILFAQAVPDADFIPCVGPLPVGWAVDSVGTRTGEAVIVFENDAYDAEAVGTLAASCTPLEASSPTNNPAITLNNDGDGLFAYAFAGGCFAIELPPEVSDADTAALLDAITFLTRDQLRSMTGWTL